MNKTTKLKIRQWGKSLAVCIPSTVAKAARLTVGQRVEVTVQCSCLVVKPIGEPKLTLAQKLAFFEPATHGGEAMPIGRVGAEVFR